MPLKTAWLLDDDEFILRALHRTLKRICPDWQLVIFSEAPQLLQALGADAKPDLVICDRVMPDFSGEQVLSQVRSQVPAAVRVLLTADTEAEVVTEDCRDIHHFLGKPFSEKDLLQVFCSAEQLLALPLQQQCREELGLQHQLPILPSTFRDLQQQTQCDKGTHQDVAVIIAKDAVLTGKIMQLANSPFLGFSRKTAAIEEAVARLGWKMVESIACILYTEPSFASMIDPSQHQKVMQDAYQLAMIARRLAKCARQPLRIQDLVFMSALLSSLGLLTLLAQGRGLNEALNLQQLQHHQADYLLISAYILALWGFEAAVCETLLQQVKLQPQEETEICALLLHLAKAWTEQQDCPDDIAEPFKQGWIQLKNDCVTA